MNRVVMQEGYDLPFDAYRRRKKRRGGSRGLKRMQSKMKSCAKKWNKSGSGSYRSFMKRCLKSR